MVEKPPPSAEQQIAERILHCYDLFPVMADDTEEAVAAEVAPFVRKAEAAAAQAAREEMKERCASACEQISEGDGMAFAEIIRAIGAGEDDGNPD